VRYDIYIYMCVCVCVCVYMPLGGKRIIHISNQRDVTLSSFFIVVTLHVSGVPCPSSGVT
jgi:hypothetical protein